MTGFQRDLDTFENDAGRLHDFASRIQAPHLPHRRNEPLKPLHQRGRGLFPRGTTETDVARRCRTALNVGLSPGQTPLESIQQLADITSAVLPVMRVSAFAYQGGEFGSIFL
jgi:hypothetical protein